MMSYILSYIDSEYTTCATIKNGRRLKIATDGKAQYVLCRTCNREIRNHFFTATLRDRNISILRSPTYWDRKLTLDALLSCQIVVAGTIRQYVMLTLKSKAQT